MDATPERLSRFASLGGQRRTYAAMLAAMDEAIGRVLDKLKAVQLEEDTLIYFFSDNGGPTMRGTTVNASINTPLRGSKRTTLEGGVRVPFVIRWPGRLPAGTTYTSPVIQLDLLPTALAAAGVELPYLTGQRNDKPHEALYWRFGPQMAIRHGDWKLVRYDTAADGEPAGVTPAKLYNLAADIGESNDLIAQQPEKAKELQAAWDKWNTGNAPPRWGGGGGQGKGKGKARNKNKGKDG
jgi:arylsulfatase A-like enzyme